MISARLLPAVMLVVVTMIGFSQPAHAQPPVIRSSHEVPAEVKSIYRRGVQYLAKKQKEDGSWPAASGYGSDTAGVCSLCLLALLSTGEDPNFGLYANNIRRGLRHLILQQNLKSGLFPGNTYDYGFALLVLAEAYGAVDDSMLWVGTDLPASKKRSIGEALELAVRAAIIPNAEKGFRGPAWFSTASDRRAGIPDTSVAGSVLVGLFAARNAGIDVPDALIDNALNYFRQMTSEDGSVGYYMSPANNFGNSMARSSIAALVFAIGKRKHWEEYQATAKFIADRLDMEYDRHPYYGRYYMAQALFQSNYEAWQKWNREMIRIIGDEVHDDGSIGKCEYGPSYSTAMCILTLAPNYCLLPIYER